MEGIGVKFFWDKIAVFNSILLRNINLVIPVIMLITTLAIVVMKTL